MTPDTVTFFLACALLSTLGIIVLCVGAVILVHEVKTIREHIKIWK